MLATTHDEMLAKLPKERRAKIAARAAELHREVEELSARRLPANRKL
jgi:hypothetical protein